MLYLLLAILSSAMVSIVIRLSSDRISGNISMLAMNYLTCVTVAACYTGFGNLFPPSPDLPHTVGMGAIHGLLYLISFILLQWNVQKNGVVLSATFMKLGLLVPIAGSVLLLGEIPSLTELIGFCIAIAAILLINLTPNASVSQFRPGLILLLLGGGCADGMAKVFETLGNPALSPQFLFYTFVAAFILCLALMLQQNQRPGLPEIFFGFLIGIPNYFSAKFLLKALDTVSAVVAYPTYSVSTIFVVTIAGVFLFRERLEKQQWFALGSILVSLILLNI